MGARCQHTNPCPCQGIMVLTVAVEIERVLVEVVEMGGDGGLEATTRRGRSRETQLEKREYILSYEILWWNGMDIPSLVKRNS